MVLGATFWVSLQHIMHNIFFIIASAGYITGYLYQAFDFYIKKMSEMIKKNIIKTKKGERIAEGDRKRAQKLPLAPSREGRGWGWVIKKHKNLLLFA